jgi:hypothetical protein
MTIIRVSYWKARSTQWYFPFLHSNVRRYPISQVLAWGVHLSNTLPKSFVDRIDKAYSEINKELKDEQLTIHQMDRGTAKENLKRYLQNLRLLKFFKEGTIGAQPKSRKLFTTVHQVVETLNENVFLMNLILHDELEPSDRLEDLLEDYRDGKLVIETRNSGEYLPWNEIKAKLEFIHIAG